MNTIALPVSNPKCSEGALAALRDDAQVREWMGIFYRATGLAIRLVRPDCDLESGETTGHEHHFCTTSGVKGTAVCCETRRTLHKKLQTKLIPQLAVCGTGLTEVAVPVVVAGRHCATFLVGQTFCEKPDAASWARLVSLMGDDFDTKQLAQLRSAYLKGQVLPEKTLQTLAHTVALHARKLVGSLPPVKRATGSKKRRVTKTSPHKKK